MRHVKLPTLQTIKIFSANVMELSPAHGTGGWQSRCNSRFELDHKFRILLADDSPEMNLATETGYCIDAPEYLPSGSTIGVGPTTIAGEYHQRLPYFWQYL